MIGPAFAKEVVVNARRFADALGRAAEAMSRDVCPRCHRPDVVVVRATTKGSLYGACRSCDTEVLL